MHFASGECFLNFVLLLLFLHSLLRLVIQGLYSWSGDDRRACVWCTIVIQYHAHCCITTEFDVAYILCLGDDRGSLCLVHDSYTTSCILHIVVSAYSLIWLVFSALVMIG